jgi:hypothetical protein
VDPDLGSYFFFDGSLQLWPSGWLVLLDRLGSPIEGRWLNQHEQIVDGSTISLSHHSVRVLRCNSTPSEVRSPARGAPLSDIVRLDRWKITYSTVKDLDRGRMKSYDGFLEIRKRDNFMILNNAKGRQIGYRFISHRDDLILDSKLIFPMHIVRVGYTLKFVPRVLNQDPKHVSTATSNSKDQIDQAVDVISSSRQPSSSLTDNEHSSMPDIDHSEVSMAVHASVLLGLDFSHGKNFAKDVKTKFLSVVHPSETSGNFIMIVYFGRSSFKLCEDLVSISLESIIGGLCGSLKVSLLNERVFSFCVANKDVGFHILQLKKYSCS